MSSRSSSRIGCSDGGDWSCRGGDCSGGAIGAEEWKCKKGGLGFEGRAVCEGGHGGCGSAIWLWSPSGLKQRMFHIQIQQFILSKKKDTTVPYPEKCSKKYFIIEGVVIFLNN
jgi:hypothetical protein